MTPGRLAGLWLAGAAFAAPAKPKVLVAPFSGVISPVAAEFMTGALDRAKSGGYDAVVLELDTPGGLDQSMRAIVQAELASKTPVIVYVHPAGARAASAGVFITLAAHVAAMAPGTNIGAAHPVLIPTTVAGAPQEKKEDKDEVLEGKMVNDAAAYLRSIAKERGRNEAWAEEAVTKSVSLPVAEAVAQGIVDLQAASIDELLRAVDGRKFLGLDKPLRTVGADVETLEMTRRQRLLAALSDPNVAVILMSLGAAGLFIELYNPGLILPGIVGAVSLVCAFYSFQTLSASLAGVVLLLLGLIFFLLEIKVASYGMLGLGGVASTLLGILMLFRDQGSGGLRVSSEVIAGTVGGMLAVTAGLATIVARAARRKVATGVEAMAGTRGRAATALSPKGKVRLHGELWDATAIYGPVAEGAEVVVVCVDGLTLNVRASE